MEPYIARCVLYITNEMQLIQCSLLLSALYMFRAGFLPIIRSLYNCMCSLGCCRAFLLSTAGVVRVEQHIHTSGRQQESMTIPEAAHTVYKLLMMGGKPVRNMYIAGNNKEHCVSGISLVI
jgi:hypothetical protein